MNHLIIDHYRKVLSDYQEGIYEYLPSDPDPPQQSTKNNI